MIGRGGRINPALWGYIHHATDALAQELWAICGWESLAPPTEEGDSLLLETGDTLLLESGAKLLLE